MTVDPGTREGRRRKRRGLLVLVLLFAAVVLQGLVLGWAQASGFPMAWVCWVLLVALLVVGFVLESRFEARRRRRSQGPK